MNGQCVRLVRGDFDQRMVYSDDPATIAVDFARAGAERLHVVDLDAARGEKDNRTVIEEVIEAGLAVQVAGGGRTMDQVETWINAGAGAVGMGTAAGPEPGLLAGGARRDPGQVVTTLQWPDG